MNLIQVCEIVKRVVVSNHGSLVEEYEHGGTTLNHFNVDHRGEEL